MAYKLQGERYDGERWAGKRDIGLESRFRFRALPALDINFLIYWEFTGDLIHQLH